MISMVLVGSLLALITPAAIVGAFVADRRRALRVDADGSRFAGPVLNPQLPWLRTDARG